MSRAAFKSSAALGRSRYRLGLAAWMAFMAFHATVLGLVFTSAPALPTAAPAALALWLAAQVVLLLPFEYLSGHHFPKKIGREIAFSVWLGQWARATAIQLALFGLFAALIMGSAAMVGHNWGGWLTFTLVMLLLAGSQTWVAFAIAPFSLQNDTDRGRTLAWFDAAETAFSGGIAGLPGQESLVMPARWKRMLPERVFRFILIRRQAAIRLGAHGRGVMLALGWNLAAFILPSVLPGVDLATAPGLITAVGVFVGLNALGALTLLRAAGRRAVAEADLWAFFEGQDADVQREAYTATARLHDEFTATKAPLFQLRPSDADRQAFLSTQKKQKGAWQAASYALYYGWAGLSLLGRVWPGRTGIPALWVFGGEE